MPDGREPRRARLSVGDGHAAGHGGAAGAPSPRQRRGRLGPSNIEELKHDMRPRIFAVATFVCDLQVWQERAGPYQEMVTFQPQRREVQVAESGR